MPELPEIEAVARTLRPLVSGKRILRCHIVHSIAVRPSSGRGTPKAALRLRKNVTGKKIRDVGRRAKYLLLLLDGGCIVMHFRLSGQLVWFDLRRISGHVDVVLETARGILGFVDQRHLGRVQWVRSLDEIEGIRQLGVEPLSSEFTPKRLAELLRASRAPLKVFLLDQRKIAGLGNIYSNEALWRARLDPRRLADHLTESEARRLHKAIVEVLRRALKCCLHPAPNFRDPHGWFQGLERMLRVYDREGQACRRCGNPIRRLVQQQRSTFWYPGCQK